MKSRWWAVVIGLGSLALASAPAPARARGLDVEVWSSRGDDAVYQPGDRMEIEARASEDAYLLVYEIDAEGAVRLLYPLHHGGGFVEGRRTYAVPPEASNVDLVAEGPVGQCYVVAIASREAFEELPWYLRPYDLQAEHVGYDGMRNDEEGITAEGRIVGDPFVAMERIRRRVVADAEDGDGFATSYLAYYVHNEVRYPRYLCYDCHRPGRWAWWAGFDPYYAHCSVIDFRVNWGWTWGPRYWFGSVPYYAFVVRSDCPPWYRQYYRSGARFSSWDGWRRWSSMWGDRLVRYKSDPPRGYNPPAKSPDQRVKPGSQPTPPGFIVGDRSGSRTGRLIARDLDRGSRRSREVSRGDGPRETRRGSDVKPGSGRGSARPERTRGEDSRRSPRSDDRLGAGRSRGAREERSRIESPRPPREGRSSRSLRGEDSRREWPGARGAVRPREAPQRAREAPVRSRETQPNDTRSAPDPAGRGHRVRG